MFLRADQSRAKLWRGSGDRRGVRLDRSRFEVVAFEGQWAPIYLKYFGGVLLNRLKGMKGVTVQRTNAVEFGPGAPVQIDGEAAGIRPRELRSSGCADAADAAGLRKRRVDVATHALDGWTLARCRTRPAHSPCTWICGARRCHSGRRCGSGLRLRATPIICFGIAVRLIPGSSRRCWRSCASHWCACIARRPLPLFKAGLVALAGGASHLLIDAINPLGAQWLWPLSETWFHADLIVRGDPWIGAILRSWGPRRFFTAGQLGNRGQAERGRGAAIFALVLALLYIGARQQFHLRAIAMLESRIY